MQNSRRRVRILFGSNGWPCGVLEVASWAVNQGLADAVICPLEPLSISTIPQEVFSPGTIGEEIGRISHYLEDRGIETGSPVALRRIADNIWQLETTAGRFVLRICKDGTDVFDSQVYAHFSRLEEIKEQGGLLEANGFPTALGWEVLATVGPGFAARLAEFCPHVVGFRVEAGQTPYVARVIRTVRKLCDAEIVLGGPTATSHPAEVLEVCSADYVFCGEAEQSFALFLKAALSTNQRESAADIPGLTFRFGGCVYVNRPPLDGYGRPIVDGGADLGVKRPVSPIVHVPRKILTENRLRWELLEGFERLTFDSFFLTGGRGCPGQCTFCARLHGKSVRNKTAEQILEEIEQVDRLVRTGRLRVSQWKLYRWTNDPQLQNKTVAWAAIFDEDFFLDKQRAVRFFELWEQSACRKRYRLNFQTNPCSLLKANGDVDSKLVEWIGRLKPMIQLGAESFHPEQLARWRKRHNVEQLETVCYALDETGIDYNVFQLLSDYESTAEELIDALRLLGLAAFRHPRMRIASTAFMIPLYDSDVRRRLEFAGLLEGKVTSFQDFEVAHPEWMDPLAACLAERIDRELHAALDLPQRDGAILAAAEAVVSELERRAGAASFRPAYDYSRQKLEWLRELARFTLNELREACFRLPPGQTSCMAGDCKSRETTGA